MTKEQSATKKQKEWLRKTLKSRRASITTQEHAFASKKACELLIQHIPVKPNDVVSLFWPLGDEINTRPALKALSIKTIVTCLPHTPGPGLELLFRRYAFGDRLAPASFGVMEPLGSSPLCKPDILVVPLLGFDHDCVRIGYGGGFYDRTIAALRLENRARYTVGLAFACQKSETIPVEPFDIRLDAVVTECGVIKAKNNRN